MLSKTNSCETCFCMLLFSCVLFDRNFTCSSQFSDFSCWRYIPFKLAHRARTRAGVAERYTRLSQKQVPQGLRVRISPPAPRRIEEAFQARREAVWGVFFLSKLPTLRQFAMALLPGYSLPNL